MKVEGWSGRKILVEEVISRIGPQEPRYYAWTGSHRIDAAKKTGLRAVPCLIIEAEEADAAFENAGFQAKPWGYSSWQDCVVGGREDVSRLEALEKTDLHDATALMRKETKEGGGRWLLERAPGHDDS